MQAFGQHSNSHLEKFDFQHAVASSAQLESSLYLQTVFGLVISQGSAALVDRPCALCHSAACRPLPRDPGLPLLIISCRFKYLYGTDNNHTIFTSHASSSVCPGWRERSEPGVMQGPSQRDRPAGSQDQPGQVHHLPFMFVYHFTTVLALLCSHCSSSTTNLTKSCATGPKGRDS